MASRLSRSAVSTDNLNDLLTCSICYEAFGDGDHQPKLLPCHHSFCKQCLLQLARNHSFVDCPTCRERSPLPCAAPAGVYRLQTNFYVTQMRDILIDDGRRVDRVTCRVHNSSPLAFFCSTCEVEICKECCNTEHTAHAVLERADAVAEQQGFLDMEMTEARHIVTVNAAHIRSFETEIGALYSAKEKARKDTNAAFDRYIEVINQRRQHLLEEVTEEFKGRKAALSTEVETLKRQVTSLAALLEQCMEAHSGECISDILAYKAKMLAKNKDIRKENQSHSYQDPGNNYIKFDPMESDGQFLDIINELGSLTIKDPLPTLVKPIDTTAIAGLYTNVPLIITNAMGKFLENYPISVDIDDPYDEITPCVVQYRSNGRYEITFRPKISGLHHVKVKFLDHVLSGAGFSINALSNNPVSKISAGQEENLEYPRAVAVDRRNSVYVVDTGNSCIQKFDRNQDFVFSFPLCPENSGLSSCAIALDEPNGLLVCPEVFIHEADICNANAILVYTSDGQLCSRFTYRELLLQALSVAVSSTGHVVVADSELDMIFIMDKHGLFLKKFGGTGGSPGFFNRPTFVCIGENDCIIVSDGDNHRIQVFDKNGKFLYMFGERGSGKGQLCMPFGVVVDYHGNILVVDGGNHRVQIYKEGGEFVSCIESLADPMRAPRGIAVTTDGHVWVADRDNHCIKKFKYLHCTSL